MRHITAYYMDGILKIEYCTVCGYEGVDLICDCPGEFKPSNKKSVDNINGSNLEFDL